MQCGFRKQRSTTDQIPLKYVPFWEMYSDVYLQNSYTRYQLENKQLLVV